MIIEPKILKGFRDFFPEQEIERRSIAGILEDTFKKGGFVPIDTPVLEYEEVLLGKGGGDTDKQVYRFTDHGGRDVAMRFDLTVPFARYVAAYYHQLYMPFKRYHLSKVWRGENTQKGRYREFMQCDFDIVGTDSVHADFEILLLMYESFSAMGIDDITIKLSHRGIFNSLLTKLSVEDQQTEILRIVDKLSKIGRDNVSQMLSELISADAVDSILSFIESGGDFETSLPVLIDMIGENNDHIGRLQELYEMMKVCGIEDTFVLDTSITRGLDYYTGIVYETYLNKAEKIGAVCSGGRYDNLASLYTKEIIPGVGASIGLDRLMAGLEELGLLKENSASVDVIIFNMDENLGGYYHSLCHKLRERGVSAEMYPEQKKLGHQFKFAEKKHIPFAVLCGGDEYQKGVLTLKDLNKRENITGMSVESIAEKILGSR